VDMVAKRNIPTLLGIESDFTDSCPDSDNDDVYLISNWTNY
jgi:hypothetical protein